MDHLNLRRAHGWLQLLGNANVAGANAIDRHNGSREIMASEIGIHPALSDKPRPYDRWAGMSEEQIAQVKRFEGHAAASPNTKREAA